MYVHIKKSFGVSTDVKSVEKLGEVAPNPPTDSLV